MRDRFNVLLEELQDMYDRKNADYGDQGHDTNLYAVRSLGLSPFVGVLVRMSDKMARIATITRKGEHRVKNETVIDSLKDLCVYSLLAIILYEEEQQLKK